jgi:hypothetical protein
MQWQTHPIIEQLINHKHANIPPLPNQELLQQKWLTSIAKIAKTTNTLVRTITTKYTMACVRKAISKYSKLYEKNPKKIHKKVFNNQETPPLDCITDRYNNILTNPLDLANEIHIQESSSNNPTIPTCYHQPEHIPNCTCGVRQYPWHDLDGLVLD